MRNFKIVMTAPGQGDVFMDGEKVEGVKAVEFRAGVGQTSMVTLTFNAAEVEIEAEVEITTIGDSDRVFAKST